MLTPQELQDRVAGLEKAVFGGYSVSSVEELMAAVQEDYGTLSQENAMLKGKLKLLATKLEEYREREDNIKKTMMKAQSAADEMVSAAERKSARMLSDTEQRLRQRSKELSAEVLAEQQRATMAKEATARYIVELEERIQAQLLELERIKAVELTPEPGAAPKPLQRGERRAATRPPAVQPEQEPRQESAETPEPEPETSAEPSAPAAPAPESDPDAQGYFSRMVEESIQKDLENQELGNRLTQMMESAAGENLDDTLVVK